MRWFPVGPPTETVVTPVPVEKVLNVHVNETDFALVWKQGATVVSEVKVPKPPLDPNAKHIRYTELAKKIEAEWAQHGGHRDPSDKKVDQAIMHTDNRLPFKEIIAVLDALYSPQRDMKFPDGSTKKVPVFNMTFSVR